MAKNLLQQFQQQAGTLGHKISSLLTPFAKQLGNQQLIQVPGLIGPKPQPPSPTLKTAVNTVIKPQSGLGQLVRGNVGQVVPAVQKTLSESNQQAKTFTDLGLKSFQAKRGGSQLTPEEQKFQQDYNMQLIGGTFNPEGSAARETIAQSLVPKAEKISNLLTKHIEPSVTNLEGHNNLFKNLPTVLENYTKRVMKRFGTSNFISADEAKHVIPGFNGINSGDYHDASSALAKSLFEDKLATSKGTGNNTVMFTSGGTGSGKTTALLNAVKDLNKYPIIYDGNLTGQGAINKVGEALKNGYDVEINYVQRSPVDAFENGVLPRVKKEGRLVTMDEHIARHTGSYETLDKLKQLYGDQIKINYIDNTTKGKSFLTTFDNLPKFGYNKDELQKTLNEKLTQSVQKGEITPEEARAIQGENLGGNEKVLSMDGGQPQQKPQNGVINTEPLKTQQPQEVLGTQQSGNIQPSSLGGTLPPESDPVKKIITALKEAKPIRGSQEALYTKARGQKLARAIAVGQKTSGESGFFQQLGQLKGELPKSEYESLRPKVTQQDVDTLFDRVKTSPDVSEWERFTAGSGLMKILGKEGGQVPTEGEIKTLNRVFGKEFTDTVMSKRSTFSKVLDVGGQVLNLPRALMSTLDLSAPLRQGIVLSGRKEWYSAFGSMFKQAGSEKAFQAVQDSIRQKPSYDLMKQYGLALTDLEKPLAGREEAVMSDLAEKIPGIGKLVRGSNRAYTGFLNKLRADTFDNLVTQAKTTGAFDDPHFIPSLTSFINNATGRGDLGKLQKAATVLNGVFFSPRLMASRINMLNPAYYVTLQPEVRKEAMKSMLSFGAMASTVLGLAKLGGAEVGVDPRNSDFGKVKVGNTRYDILGGFQQYIKLASQLSTGKLISSTTGKEITVGEGYKPMTRKDILQRFVESKSAPVTSLILDMLRGESVIGEKLDPKSMIVQRFTPMILQDMQDAYTEWGAKGIAMSVPSVFGVGIQTYGGTPVNLQEAEQRGSVDLYRYLKTLPKAEANAYTQKLDDKKYKQIAKFKEVEDRGLGVDEMRLTSTGVKSGERAKMIWKKLQTFKTKEQKNAYITRLGDLVTDEVYNQLGAMKK